MTELAGILLAAGAAERFGSSKLLHPLSDGTPIGVAAARALLPAVPNTVAIVRPDDPVLTEAFLGIGLRVVENIQAEKGMGSSLAAGVRATAEAQGWLIALADMPWIHPHTVRLLADSLSNGASMVAPVYAGRRGHPVGFASCWREKLMSLHSDRGARDLITEHADGLILLNTMDVGVLKDIDHPRDLNQISQADTDI